MGVCRFDRRTDRNCNTSEASTSSTTKQSSVQTPYSNGQRQVKAGSTTDPYGQCQVPEYCRSPSLNANSRFSTAAQPAESSQTSSITTHVATDACGRNCDRCNGNYEYPTDAGTQPVLNNGRLHDVPLVESLRNRLFELPSAIGNHLRSTWVSIGKGLMF